MNASSVKLYSLSYQDIRTYLVTIIFIVGNILLPQLCHLIPNGGLIFLPIYFFTLIAAYKYGWKTGVLTAIFSPLANTLLFGMPAMATLPVIMMKSVLLATIAGYAAYRFNKINLSIIAGVVLSYQVIGGLFELAYTGSFTAALQDFRIGIPGMLLQIFGGYILIKYLLKK